ncbi:OB-fold nucleic acid binding domain-containing protein [Alkalibacillus haloalkaliphilus]|uniref:OB domain-containing protein n=1 Tax=Alkalibacillus haloalkaliphilus TaxID=94136 RepID=A0A511WBH8_9BACI|nr:OB-fold nucleic acid binding domain-containing protein [Alkalibacillus haloalkaliphilus]GEN46662.1 hypothetical protein AHA02nite_24380 [Alkalibacillus haloalkaliphilus]
MGENSRLIVALVLIGAVAIVGVLLSNQDMTFLDNDSEESEQLIEATANDDGTSKDSNITNYLEGVVSINEVTEEFLDQTVSIEGTVQSIDHHEDDHIFLEVSDETGSMSVPLFADNDIDHSSISEDETYIFTGSVNEFQGEVEVVPENQSDINLINSSPTTITEDHVGEVVNIEAQLLTKHNHPDGHVFMTVLNKDTDEEIDVPVFNQSEIATEDIPIDSTLIVNGMVNTYNDNLQVIPQNQEDLQVIEKGNDEGLELMDIGHISEEDRGNMFDVRGSVTSLNEHDGHLFFTLSNGEEEIDAVLFEAHGEEIEGRKVRIRDAYNNDFPIRVLAMVNIYNDELQIIVEKVYNEY